jgi:hypothetical protein
VSIDGGNNSAGTLTRRQSATLLGVSTSSVRRLEGTALHPVRGADGVVQFDAAEGERVAEMHRTRPHTPPAAPEHKPAEVPHLGTSATNALGDPERLTRVEAQVRQLQDLGVKLAQAVRQLQAAHAPDELRRRVERLEVRLSHLRAELATMGECECPGGAALSVRCMFCGHRAELRIAAEDGAG